MSNIPTRQHLRHYWSVPENYCESWDPRADIAASFLADREHWICDIGCGAKMPLKKAAPGRRYLCADMMQWNSEVALCDFNEPIALPKPQMLAADVCFFLGVFEYIYDVRAAVSALPGFCDTLIFSYCSTDVDPTRWEKWVNAFSAGDILNIFRDAGFAMERSVAYMPGQYVFRVKNKVPVDPDARAAARAELGL